MSSFIKKTSTFFLSFFSPNMRDNILGIKRFNFKKRKHPEKQLLILFVDGKSFHGGLCDRFKGIVSLFHYSICNNIAFRIEYVYPFDIQDYLQINEYDWRLRPDNELTFHFFESKYMYMIQDGSPERLLKLKTERQIHAYANRDVISELNEVYRTNYQWGDLFKKLFEPTENLRCKISEYQQQIAGDYVCVQFRFQNLLGDVIEDDGSPELTTEEKKQLIGKCKNSLLHIQSNSTVKRILVTSDSYFFLQEILGLNSIYVFPEKIVHIDTIKSKESYDTFMKPFLDFYLLSESKKIYSVGTEQMYKSEFPLYAAKLNNIPFERIHIE